MKKKTGKTKKPYSPRVLITMNTGTRVMKSKKDKMNSRRALNQKAKDYDL